MLNKHFGSDMR